MSFHPWPKMGVDWPLPEKITTIAFKQSLHKPPTSANTAAKTETSTNTFRGGLCAPPACVNTARPTDPSEDAFSPTSKGYLIITLSSAPNGQSAAVSLPFFKYIGNSSATHHPLDHMTTTLGGSMPLTMQHTHACALHSSHEDAALMLGVCRWGGGHCHWDATRGVILDRTGVG